VSRSPARGDLHLRLAEGWRVEETRRIGPFVTRAVLVRPDGTTVEWTSRRHRKSLGLRDRAAAQALRRARPSPSSVLIGALFMIGSSCFALGSLPLYFDRVAASTDAWTFFVGSIFFTSAAYLQYREAGAAPLGPEDGAPTPGGIGRFVSFSPRRLDWWATSVQFVGTIFFNVTTFAATRTDVDLTQEKRLIWAPDVLGSICFLVASWFAYVEVAGDREGGHASLGWWIATLNLAGSVAFGFSAVGARYLDTGEIANITLVNVGTFAGAVCFFVGAALLPVESMRDSQGGRSAANGAPPSSS